MTKYQLFINVAERSLSTDYTMYNFAILQILYATTAKSALTPELNTHEYIIHNITLHNLEEFYRLNIVV